MLLGTQGRPVQSAEEYVYIGLVASRHVPLLTSGHLGPPNESLSLQPETTMRLVRASTSKPYEPELTPVTGALVQLR